MSARPMRPHATAAIASRRVLGALRRREPLRRFLAALCGAIDAADGSAWLVGGFVRDLAEGRPGKDVDLLVAGLTDDRLASILRALPRPLLGIRRIARAGKRFPVYRIRTDWAKEEIDVALARRGAGGVAPGPSGGAGEPQDEAAREDAARRDFTINSLLFALRPRGSAIAGEIVDSFGGLRDLRRRLIRGVGDAEARLTEDPVRILRAVRFRNERPGYAIERGTRRAIRRAAPRLIGAAPADRLAADLVRSLAADPVGTVDDLRRLGLLPLILPEIGAAGPGSAARMRRRYGLLRSAFGRRVPETLLLAAFLIDVADAERAAPAGRIAARRRDGGDGPRLARTEAAARRLHLPGVRRVVRMIDDAARLDEVRRGRNPHARIERILARWKEPRHLLVLYEASRRARGAEAEDFRPLLRLSRRRPPLISGRDVLGLGAVEGPAVEGVLEAVREATLTGGVKTREEGIAAAAALLAGGPAAFGDRRAEGTGRQGARGGGRRGRLRRAAGEARGRRTRRRGSAL